MLAAFVKVYALSNEEMYAIIRFFRFVLGPKPVGANGSLDGEVSLNLRMR